MTTHKEVLDDLIAAEILVKEALGKLDDLHCAAAAWPIKNDPMPPTWWMTQDIKKTSDLLQSQIFNLRMTLHSRAGTK